ncbi:polysaccharide biosynthesis protein [Granulosicoccus antarcticus]|uniref:UDP-N-acetyl-alpha-D-glucosamine C6 dehydratase n=1 Tax=Granulosicoccus antarcticus IMCC3135 TaxID=1192854 RepID=A0A2Z2NVR5_9GAMM|nr:nucleoside-diphosphate sugar epimerase/dehydratase [Granulosicoccus antarcticus]ASJ74615.1 UDP-N-acetyl-alpha-D-glucosamine C6 dehydratase [Granulosicoccus antarcticus IMCC3135]
MTERHHINKKNTRNNSFSTSLDNLIRNMADTGRGRKQAVSITADMGMAAICLWLAYTLRHGMAFSDFRSTWYLFVALPILTAVVFSGLGIYRWVIRSSNQRLYKQLVKGSIVSALSLLVVFSLVPPDRANPRSLFVIYALLLIGGTIGMRMLWKSIFDSGNQGEPVAIYGAGAGGRQLAGLLREGGEFRPVAFIDDNPNFIRSTLSGLPVIAGDDSQLRAALKRLDTESVVLAMPSISSSGYQQKVAQIDELGFRVLTMPSVGELISGKIRADEIRDVSITDILGRLEVAPNISLMGRKVAGKTVLVTGGGGSIGSELCRQIMKLAPAQLLILDNCEANLYHITEEFNALIAKAEPGEVVSFVPLIGSVTDAERVKRLFAKFKIDTVYHAAAYKHVPIVEAQPDQGVDVNVFGTLTVLNAAIESGAGSFVLISTDKAVRPTNAMGGTKRVAELILQAKARLQSSTNISMVRFGNVLGSSGSVVPKFKKQIKGGGPITLTHTDITRYFMTIPEAAQLVLQASAIAQGGDVFVLDMGEPVRIEALATTMVRLYGRKLQRDTGDPADIEIVVEGLRPGEKMYEELFLTDSCSETEVAKISTANEDWLSWDKLKPVLDELAAVTLKQDAKIIKSLIMSLAFLDDAYSAIPVETSVESDFENSFSTSV